MADSHTRSFFIEALHKYSQKNNVKVNYRELSRTGPPHDSRFTFQVIIDEEEYPEAEGKSKKEARDAAAKLALEKLQTKGEVSSSFLTTDSLDDLSVGNYVGQLNRLSQKTKLPVNYHESFTNGPERFSCKCLIGEKEYSSAVGSTKQKAKQLAAKLAHEKILAENDLMKDDSVLLNSPPAGSSGYEGSSSMTCGTESPSENGFSASGSDRSNNSDSFMNTPLSSQNRFRSSLGKVKRFLAPNFDSPCTVGNDHTMNERFLKEFSEITPIGSGAYGNVFKAKHKLDGKTYVVKRVKYDTENKEKVAREVKALAALDHPNIVRYYSSWDGTDNAVAGRRNRTECLFIQMDFCDKGTLEQWIDSRKGNHQDKQLSLELFEQIVTGVNYIHSKALIHRDIKPSNIFLVSRKQIKIGDFGLVTFQEYNEKRTRDKGTPMYMSPEQISSPEYGNEVDIFALGLILAELLYIPSTRSEILKLLGDLRHGRIWDVFDHKEKILLGKLVSDKPKTRPKTSEILNTLKEWKAAVKERKMRHTY
ncbi:interferon-induced, double-stranded RNA-activated protein kinase [Pteronotus mesoamericanus]|uniref:interferon-induced, double-stranded RNA-activated protein kinase n=1 Tax=Pteronotus mesoamericanus TaxID=1884717 RepID=UPI0023EC7046|nr:interferon-induced, double-stranded RNA-activated protein kinase [Pteronotus parnellii mesoamericanus]